MKKDIDIDEFKDIMLGKKIQKDLKNDKKIQVIKEKKKIINTTFEEPKEIKNTNYRKNINVNLDDFENIMLGNKSEKQVNVKIKKKIVINTTFEEPKEIKRNIDFKNNNFTIEEFENLMLGVSLNNKNKKISLKQNTKIIEEVPVIKSILIDGSNVLRIMYKMKTEKDKNYRTEDMLIQFLYEYLKQYIIDSYDKISLFLDGEKRKINTSNHPHIQLEFSNGKPADDLIVNDLHITVEQQPNIRKEVILITNDKGLIGRCRDIFKNITVMSSDDFLIYLGHSKNFKFLNKTNIK